MKTTLLLLPCLLLPVAGQARESGQDEHAIDEVVVEESARGYAVRDSSAATKLELPLRETPQSITIVSRQRIDDQNLRSLRDVLDNTTGVYSYQWDTERVLFTSRGFVVDALLYDGVPAITNFSTDSIDETLDTALYERIEIVRGATGLMTGAGSPAASVNLVRKHADARELEFAADATFGRWDDRRVEADLSTPLNASGSIRARIVGVYSDRDSYQALYNAEKVVFYGVIDADLGPNTLLSVGYDYQRYRPESNTWGSFPLFLSDGSPANWPRSVTTSTNWAFWDKDKETVFAELRHTFANDWTLRSSLTSRVADEDFALFYMYGFPDVATGRGLEPYAFRGIGEADERMLDLYATGPFGWFGREHALVLGITGSVADLDGREFDPGPMADPGNFFEWDGSYPSPGFDTGGYLSTDIETRQRAVYAAARLSLADPLTLIAGARRGDWDVDYWYIWDSPENGFEYDYSTTVPYAGLVYDISDSFSAFVSYTEIFKPQNARTVDNTYLEPMDGESVDLGIKGTHFDGRLNTALTLFETRQDNVAAPVFDDSGAPVLLPDLTQASRPVDGTRARGFELEVAGQLMESWNASIGWSRYILEDADGAPVNSYIPRTAVRLFTKWTPEAYPDLSIGGGVNWQSESRSFVGAPDGGTTLEQGSVTLLSIMARYRITPSVYVQVNGENLLDEKYYVLDNYDNTYYGAPVSYSMSVGIEF